MQIWASSALKKTLNLKLKKTLKIDYTLNLKWNKKINCQI